MGFDHTHPLWDEVNNAFVEAYWKDKGKTLRAEAAKDFEDNAKQIGDKISLAIGQMSESAVNDSLLRLLKAFTAPDLSSFFGNTASKHNVNDISFLFGNAATQRG